MGTGMRTIARTAVVAVAVLSLAGCGISSFDPFGKKQEPLPGKRISVLVQERALSPDSEVQGSKILLPRPTPNPSWPMAGGYADHAMQHIQIAKAIKQRWSADIGAGSGGDLRITAQPIVAAGKVFALDSEHKVTAFKRDTGERVWRTNVTPKGEGDELIPGGIAYEDGRIFVTTGFAEVVALDADSGKVVWRHNVSGPMHSGPTVRDGRVFAVTIDNHLFALDAKTGKQLWTYEGATETAALLGGAAPAVSGDTVVAAFTSGDLIAFDVSSGRLLWQDSLVAVRRTELVSTLAQIRGLPVIDRGKVIAISHAGLMAEIDQRTGRRVWDREIGGVETPWVAGKYIYVVTNDDEIACVGREDGKIYWVRALPQYEDPESKDNPIIWSGPVLASDRLLVAGTQGKVLAVSPYTGRILGSADMPDGVSVPPVIADGWVFFLANDANLVAYR